MTAPVTAIAFPEGDTLIIALTAYGSDGVSPLSLLGASVTFYVKSYAGVLLSAAMTITDSTNGLASLSLNSTLPAGSYDYFIRATLSGGIVATLVRGRLTVTPSPTS